MASVNSMMAGMLLIVLLFVFPATAAPIKPPPLPLLQVGKAVAPVVASATVANMASSLCESPGAQTSSKHHYPSFPSAFSLLSSARSAAKLMLSCSWPWLYHRACRGWSQRDAASARELQACSQQRQPACGSDAADLRDVRPDPRWCP